MAISKERPLSADHLSRIISELDLNLSESNILVVLRELAESKTPDDRIQCYNRMMRFSEYKHKAKADIRVYKYISAWYHIVIREMAKIKGFKLDSKWIQKYLVPKLSIKEIKKALEFLKESQFVEEKNGNLELLDPTIRCEKEVMGLALSQAHEQTLDIAAKSIDAVPSEERQLLTYTQAVSTKDIPKIHQIMEAAMNEIRSVVDETSDDEDAVYQFSFLSVPMAKTTGGEK